MGGHIKYRHAWEAFFCRLHPFSKTLSKTWLWIWDIGWPRAWCPKLRIHLDKCTFEGRSEHVCLIISFCIYVDLPPTTTSRESRKEPSDAVNKLSETQFASSALGFLLNALYHFTVWSVSSVWTVKGPIRPWSYTPSTLNYSYWCPGGIFSLGLIIF